MRTIEIGQTWKSTTGRTFKVSEIMPDRKFAYVYEGAQPHTWVEILKHKAFGGEKLADLDLASE